MWLDVEALMIFSLQIEKISTPENLDIFELLYQLNHAVCLTQIAKVSPVTNNVIKQISQPPQPQCVKTEKDEDGSDDASSSIAAISSASNLDINELLMVWEGFFSSEFWEFFYQDFV